MAVQDSDAEIVRRVGADADLYRPFRVYDTFAYGPRDKRSVVDALAIVEPCVLMRIELHEGEGTVQRGMGLEKRPRNEMIAAKRQKEGTGTQNACGFPFDSCRGLLMVA